MSVLGLSAAFFSFVVPRPLGPLRPAPGGGRCSTCVGVLVPLAALYCQGSLYMLAALVFLGWSASGTFPLFMGTIPSETHPGALRRHLGSDWSWASVKSSAASAGRRSRAWQPIAYGLAAPIIIRRLRRRRHGAGVVPEGDGAARHASGLTTAPGRR